MSDNSNHNNSRDWENRYAQQRTHNNNLNFDDQSSHSSFNFDIENELRDSHHTQYLTDNQEDITKVSNNIMSPVSNGDTTYLDNNGKTTGLETMFALDNVEVGNAALAYVVGRHELAPSASQIELKLRDSQAFENIQKENHTFMSIDSSQDKSSLNNHRFSYYQTKTPSTSNFSHYGNNSYQNFRSYKHNNRSSTSDITVSTHILFDSPDSRKALSDKGKPTYPNSSNSTSSGSIQNKKKAMTKNEEFLEENGNMFVGYYKNYNATEPLPPQSQANTNILVQSDFDKENNTTNDLYDLQKPLPNRSFSNSDTSMLSNNSANPLLSMKLQKASHQRKTKKGHVINTKHMSIYQYQQPTDVYTNGILNRDLSASTASPEVYISKHRLTSVLKLTIKANLSWQYILVCLFIPILGPILIVFLDNATFLKIVINKEKTLQEIDYIQENPYSKNQFHNGYSTREIGYFGIVSLWLEHEISSSLEHPPAKKEEIEEGHREKKVGFRDTTSVINFQPEITDGVLVDVDYTRLKYYLNNLHYRDGSIKSEFLRICLKEWGSFLYTVKLFTCLYFGLWLILSILCIILIIVFAR